MTQENTAVATVDEENVQNAQPEKKKHSSALWLKIVIAAVIVVVFGYFGFTTTVREGNCAVILRFGAPRAEITEAGLYAKLPWPFETVNTYDKREKCLETNYVETTTKDNRNIILKSEVIWNVSDPLLFHNSVGSAERVEAYINDQVFNATNSVLGSYELSALVTLDAEACRSTEIQDKIFAAVKANCEENYGINVVKVNFTRISLPDTNLTSVFEQMRAERQKDIDTILAEAQRDADRIASDADTEATRIVSDAQIEAADIYAATEAEVARIYAAAQAANLELYRFLRELDTVTASVSGSTVLVVTADTYPFNVLLNYTENDGDEAIIRDLNDILSQLNETDRNALIDAIYDQIIAAGGSRS